MRDLFFRTLPWAVLVISLAFTHDAWRDARERSDAVRSDHFDSLVRDTLTVLRDRIDRYRDATLGAAGLFGASDEVTREEWSDFQVRLGLPDRHPGSKGLGFALRVAPETPTAEEEFKAQSGLGIVPGTPPRGQRPWAPLHERFIIMYDDPFARGDGSVGFDAASVDELREAMERARDTGRSALSERVVFAPPGSPQEVVVFVLFTPVYYGGDVPESAIERDARIAGWVYAPFEAKAFVRGLFETLLKERDEHVDLTIYSGATQAANRVLYEDPPTALRPGEQELHRRSIELDLYGEIWTVVVRITGVEGVFDHEREAWSVLVAGVVTSLLFFFGTRSLDQRRRQAVALAATMTDDLVERARELRESNSALERARSRAESAADTLLEQHETLARAERLAALGEMAGGMAHELKNPIAGMMMSLENLKRESNDEAVVERLGLVTAELQRLTRLLNAYLAPVRHHPESVAEVDVASLLDDLCALVRYRLPPEIELVSSVEAPLPWRLPRDRFRQALLNLILNAYQAIDGADGHRDAHGHIEISDASPPADDGAANAELHILVSDDGPGFSEDQLRDVPQPFETSRRGGTGLGLSMVRRVAQDLGGRLELENGPQGGARARLVVPKREA